VNRSVPLPPPLSQMGVSFFMAEVNTPIYTTATFVAEAVDLLAQYGPTDEGFLAIGERLRLLAQQTDILNANHLASLHGAGATATILEEGESGNYALMLAKFLPDAPTPVHNHNSWGIACVVQGRDRYLRWERHDDGSDPKHADLKLVEEFELGPGDFVWFHGPPEDIHSQQGIGEAAWELVFFGRNPNAQPRTYFDPKDGSVSYAEATS
jgi:predicted metal-dependent enzyme (double-stranded beta helix superfamily)